MIEQAKDAVMRLINFIKSAIRLRSITLALWIDSYDSYKGKK